MTDLTIGGTTIRVEVEGDPALPVLLLSNALGTTLSLWDSLIPAFTGQFRVVRYDTRGHGGSPVGPSPVSIGDLGRDVVAILDALEIERAHVAGLSMGGVVCQWLIAHAPERIDRAVLACTAARFGPPDGWNARIRAVWHQGMAAIADATMDRFFSPDFAEREPAQVAAVRAMLLDTPPEGYAACCAALRDMDLRQGLYGVETPVLVLTGRDDPGVSAADTAVLLGALKNARHVGLPGRHIAAIEAGPAFAQAVIQFLTAKLPARRPPSPPKGRTKAARRATAAARQPIAKPGSVPRKVTARMPKSKAATAKARSPVASTAKATAAKATAAKTAAPKTSKAKTSKAKTAAPRSKTAAPRSKTAAPRSKAAAPRSKAAAPRSKAAAPRSKAAAPRSKAASTKASKPAKRAPTKTAGIKTSPAKATKPKTAKPAARRPTKTTTARGAVKKAATKAKPGKAPAKKTAAKRGSAKRPSSSRRKPAKTARRPTGRPKS